MKYAIQWKMENPDHEFADHFKYTKAWCEKFMYRHRDRIEPLNSLKRP